MDKSGWSIKIVLYYGTFNTLSFLCDSKKNTYTQDGMLTNPSCHVMVVQASVGEIIRI